MEERDGLLSELIEEKILQKMQDAFAKMARMAAMIMDEEGRYLTKPSNFTSLCSEYCRETAEGQKRCANCNKETLEQMLEKEHSVPYKCPAGLIKYQSPIRLEEKIIGSFVGGQVLVEEPDLEKMRAFAEEIGADVEGFLEAAKKVQVIPRAAVDRSAEFLSEFARIISDMAYSADVSMQLRMEAMQAAVQKSDFLANMSHEIRTPMNAVLGMAELALREEMSKEARDYVGQIQSSGKHLLVIINDILDYSKIESGKMGIVEVTYESEAMLHDVANLINNRIGKKDIEFIMDVPYDLPEQMIGDNIRIQQILVNLLNNAVKFTSKGKIILRIRYQQIAEDMVQINADVIDTGSGIKEEDQKKLFRSFQQVDSKRNRNIEGTGLGLVISKQLIEMMGGSISLTSEYGKGSTFSITYPQKVMKYADVLDLHVQKKIYYYVESKYMKEQLLEDLKVLDTMPVEADGMDMKQMEEDSFFFVERSLVEPIIQEITQENPNLHYIVMEPYDAPNDLKGENIVPLRTPLYQKAVLAALGLGKAFEGVQLSDEELFSFVAPEANILIVDDNSVNLAVAKGLLEPLQMNVDLAESAAKCVELLETKKYDIIFMDHMMPEVDGVEATHIIRRLFVDYQDVPIIALSANAVGGAQEMFLREGMNDFVAKPIETTTIVEMIRKWLPAEKQLPLSEGMTIAPKGEKVEVPVIEGLDMEEGIRMLGSEKLYMQILEEYYNTIEKRKKMIQDAMEAQDYRGFTIEVHSLKSTSKQIGAGELSSLAALMEAAGNREDSIFIAGNIDRLLADYCEVQEKLRPVFDREGAKQEEAFLDVGECLEGLLQALDEMDYLSIEEALEKFDHIQIQSEKEQEYLTQIKSLVEEYEIDDCVAVIQEWKGIL